MQMTCLAVDEWRQAGRELEVWPFDDDPEGQG